MAVSTKKKPPVISLKTRIGWIGTGVMGPLHVQPSTHQGP